MNRAGLHTLKQALEAQRSTHLDDETLAMMATTEMGGEAIELMFAHELAHLETCVLCAESYANLMVLMQEALGEMTAAANLISSAHVLAALLADRLNTPHNQPSDLQRIQQITDALSFTLTALPIQPDDVTIEAITAAAPDASPTFITTLTQAMQDNLAALRLYLNRMADSFWGQMVNLQADSAGTWRTIQLSPMARPQTALLHGAETGPTWQLFSQSVGPVPLTITAWATRLSPLACELIIRADRPGLRHPADRTIRIEYPGHSHTLTTNDSGEVRLSPVPVAALPHLKIEVGPEGAGKMTR